VWVDDLAAFHKIEAAIAPSRARQRHQNVELIHWTTPAPRLTPNSIVIEAFGCNPPSEFVAKMARQNSTWINLEYLSAESWVETCHALPSIQSNGLRKFFFFPGFTAATGGLLREPDLIRKRDEWMRQPGLRWKQLEQIGVPDTSIELLRQGGQQVFLFCYASAPAQALAHCLAQRSKPSVLIVPKGVYPSLTTHQAQNVFIHEIPFVDQNAFDQLLWGSDLNFVRGEDSMVRALWAGKPLVWQIYEQDNDAHLIKLDAWLKRSELDPAICDLMRTWNIHQGPDFDAKLNTLLNPDAWSIWQSDATRWCKTLACQADLATSLVAFCTEQRTG
jgi:uncharacterized repeat protein (TIGR03837 family)